MTASQPSMGQSAGLDTEPGAETGAETGAARYLYAVCRGLDPAAVATVRGLDDAPLELVPHLDLVAIVSTVPLSSYGEEGLRRHLEDLAWLEATVRVHDHVVHAAARQAPTAPLRLATVCYDDDAVRARLREWYISLTHVLDRVDGCSEWSVKVLTRPTAQATPGDVEPPASGADYLRRKKSEATRRTASDDAALEAARLVHDRLAEHARASRQLAPQDPRLSGHEGTMVLNAAYLVPHTDADAFAALVADLAATHADLVIDSRGPWPPYSFAMLEQR